jgi:hypothetical protein
VAATAGLTAPAGSVTSVVATNTTVNTAAITRRNVDMTTLSVSGRCRDVNDDKNNTSFSVYTIFTVLSDYSREQILRNPLAVLLRVYVCFLVHINEG